MALDPSFWGLIFLLSYAPTQMPVGLMVPASCAELVVAGLEASPMEARVPQAPQMVVSQYPSDYVRSQQSSQEI